MCCLFVRVVGASARWALSLVIVSGLVVVSVPPARAQSQAGTVSYQDVLANPDDLLTNIAFLEFQLAEADFAGASVTLQRILLLNPGFDEARLLRAAVLLRLGDDAAAASDLAYLEGQPLSPEDRAEADRLAGMVRTSTLDPRLNGLIRFGGIYESNPSQSPGSGQVGNQIFDFPADDQFGAFGELQMLGEMPLGGASGHAIRLEAHGLARAHKDGSSAHSFARLAVGPRLDLGFAFMDVMALGGVEFIGEDLYGSRLGARSTFTVDVSDRVVASFRVEAAHDAVDVNIGTDGTIGDGDGLQFILRPAITYRISDAWNLYGFATYTTKDAGSAWFSYDAFGAGLGLAYRNAIGYRVQLAVSAQDISYDAANPNLVASTIVRDETRFVVYGLAAMPVRELFALAGRSDPPAWASSWSVEAFGRYDINQSNVDVYHSSNFTFGLSLARPFSL